MSILITKGNSTEVNEAAQQATSSSL